MKPAARFRWWALLLAVVAGIVGWGMYDQPELYDAPVYESLLDMLPLHWWKALWWSVALLLIAAVVLRRTMMYVVGSVMAAGLAAMWVVGLSWAHWVDHAPLSPAGWALWAYLAATQLMVVSAPNKYERKAPT